MPAFRATFSCPDDAQYCEFLIIQFSDGVDIGTTTRTLDPGEVTAEMVDDETRYVGVKNGSARGLEEQSIAVKGGDNTTFLEGKDV